MSATAKMRPEKRQAEFVAELGRATMSDLYTYDVEIGDMVDDEPAAKPPQTEADAFQEPEEATLLVSAEEMEEIVKTPPPAPMPPTRSKTPPPLPPDAPLTTRERNFEAGLRHVMADAGFGTLAEEWIAKARAWPFRCDHIGEPPEPRR